MDEEKWYPGDIVQDDTGCVFQRGENGGWWGLGFIDEELYDELPVRPLRPMIALPLPGPKSKSRADTRLFRITRQFAGYGSRQVPPGHVEYGNKRVAATKCGAGGSSWKYGDVVKVEATDADAITGWTDVSEEFGITTS